MFLSEIKKTQKIFLIALLGAWMLLPGAVFAHQPRIVESRQTTVTNPEISKAFYGQLAGTSDTYTIDAKEPFDLYVNILVPDIADQKKDVSVIISKDAVQIASLDGMNFEWRKFYEPFGADMYWMGPEYRERAGAGVYEIQVFSGENDSKYSLAVGETEAFGGRDGLNALTTIPKLKRSFFNESPIGFIASPFGWGLILVMYLLAGFIYLILFRITGRQKGRKCFSGMGKNERIIYTTAGLVLLPWAMFTSWSPLVILLSAFALLHSAFGRFSPYAAIMKRNV